ncbi:MAG: TPM domain-containing protein, partial [Cytophagales bacterium]
MPLLYSNLANAQKQVPELWNLRVHDDAKVLKQEAIDRLENQLKAYEDSTTNQLAILTITSLDGDALEDYSIRVVEKWKLGNKNNDNGVLILMAIDDRKMRIEVGQGLEGVLTDALCNRIIRNEMAPAFRQGDFDAGVTSAVNSVIKGIGGEYKAEDGGGSNDFDSMDTVTKIVVGSIIFIFLGVFASIGLFSKGWMTWVLYAFLMPFYAAFLGLLINWWIFFGYLIFYPLFRLWIVKSGRKLLEWQSTRGGSGSGWSSGSSSSSGSSWSSSGSSFSGGGGSFGGGGSSGS